MSTLQPARIYAGLDTLLDTRLGTLNRINPELAKHVAGDPAYPLRNVDAFPPLTKEEFAAHYAKRDRTTLAHSVVSSIALFIRHLAQGLTEQSIKRPYHKGVEAVINLHPYVIPEEERLDLARAISFWIGSDVPVRLVNLTDAELTAQHCQTEYTVMFMYDPTSWLNAQMAAMADTNMRGVTVFMPAMYFGKVPTEEDINTLLVDGVHPFRAQEMLMAKFMDLRLVDVRYFCIVDNRKPLEEKPTTQ